MIVRLIAVGLCTLILSTCSVNEPSIPSHSETTPQQLESLEAAEKRREEQGRQWRKRQYDYYHSHQHSEHGDH